MKTSLSQRFHNLRWRLVQLWKEHILPAFFSSITTLPHTGKVALCCIAKSENDYIREWVEYYLTLGIDTIFLYDNNDIDGERFEAVIGEYIQSNRVILKDFRGKKICQLQAYQDCYDHHKGDFDWICYFDCDEFLTLVNHTNIHDFLSQECFNPYQAIHINWMCFGDNEQLDTDGRPVIERFPNPKPFDFVALEKFPENYLEKTIVRGGLHFLKWSRDPHSPQAPYYGCTATGQSVGFYSSVHKYDFSSAYLRHYCTKTIGEWVRVKMKRGYPDQAEMDAKQKLNLNKFFATNTKTEQKLDYASQLFLL